MKGPRYPGQSYGTGDRLVSHRLVVLAERVLFCGVTTISAAMSLLASSLYQEVPARRFAFPRTMNGWAHCHAARELPVVHAMWLFQQPVTCRRE